MRVIFKVVSAPIEPIITILTDLSDDDYLKDPMEKSLSFEFLKKREGIRGIRKRSEAILNMSKDLDSKGKERNKISDYL